MALKVLKAKGAAPSPIETAVETAFNTISVQDIKDEIANLNILAVKEVKSEGVTAYVVFVPYRQHKKFQKVQKRLVPELEKKFPNVTIVFVAQRNVLPAEYTRNTGLQRPRSRSLTVVQDAILEDIVFPYSIVGKRIRVREDGSKLLKVFLDAKEAKEAEDKVKAFAVVYNKLTYKNVEVGF